MRLSAINTIFSCKKVFAATKIQKQPPSVFCKRRPATLLLERGSSIAKFLRAPTLKNICEGLLLKISISVASLQAVVQRCFCKKGVPRNFAKFTGKQLCQSLFLNKVAGLRLWHRSFPVNFEKFVRTPFLTEHLRWLLLFCTNMIFLS